MVFGYMRLPDASRRRPVHGHAPAAGGRRAVSERATSPTAAPRSAEVDERQAHRHRRRGGAVAGFRRPHPVRRRGAGAQPDRRRRAVRRSCCPATPRPDRCKNGDVIPGGTHHGASRISTPCWTRRTAAAGHSAATISRTVVDEAYTAVGGLGPELSPDSQGATTLAIDARENLDPLTTLIDQSKPVLDSQTDTAGSIQAWAAHLAESPVSCRARTLRVAGCSTTGPGAADEVRATHRTAAAHAADRAGQPGQHRPRRRHLSAEPRAAAGAAAPGHRGHAGHRCANAKHQAGLQGRQPELQPQPQPAAAVHHRLPARPAAPRRPPRGLPRPPAGRPVLPDAAGLAVQRARCAQHSRA